MTQQAGSRDPWSSETYSAAASFVHNPVITQKVLQYLDPQPTDKVLDVGCGDAKFTSNYLDRVAEVYGVDASPSFIESAKKEFASNPKISFNLVDCRHLETDTKAVSGGWDKVISNAALHWILHDEQTRLRTLEACHAALKPGGIFVFEMGGAGNVAEVHAALTAALYHQGVSMQEARDANPWYFPNEAEMEMLLTKAGFEVEKLELEYRPTKLNQGEGGGLEGWVKLMGASFLDRVGSGKRASVLEEVCEVCKDIVGKSDGSQWLGYVRLRGVARRPHM